MANDSETPNEPAEGSNDRPAAPSYVPADEFKTFQATISQTMETLQQGIQAINASLAAQGRRAAEPTAAVDEITEEMYEKALSEGDGKTARRYVQQENRKAEARLLKDHIEPLRNAGMESIAGLTVETMSAKLKHFKRFEKEIRAKVESLPSDQRINPRIWEIAHDAVVGANVDTLVNEEREKVLRAGGGGTQSPGDGGAGRKKPDANAVPGVKELLGEEAVTALESRGLTPDEFAKKLGYKDGWAGYAARIKAQREEEAASRG